jgi:hypothetical protein
MSTTKATKRPVAKPAPMKARQAPPTSARAAPKKNTSLEKNSDGPARRNAALTRAGKGRPKGVPNAITKTAREIFSAFIEGNALKLQELFDRVAKKSPAKALSIYAKLAEFVIPKLQRTELSGELNHTVKEVPAYEDMSPEEAMRIYMETVHNTNATFKHLPSVKPYVAPPRPEIAAPLRPAQEFMPAPVRPSRPESQPEDAETVEPGPETNVTLILPRHDGEHRPIVDSKCGFCRKLWVEAQKAAQDEVLRAQRPPRVVT